jgi:hypothetical protein
MDDDKRNDDRRGGFDGPGANTDMRIEHGTSPLSSYLCLLTLFI